ncbi:MAG: 30S ribosomal protein S20 [Pirellulales bacterium]
MPNRPSSKKRLRQNLAIRDRNRAAKSAVRSQVKKVRSAVAAGDLEAGQTEFHLAVKKLDKAASKRLIHSNLAARTKSRLSAALKRLKTA